VPQLEIAEFRSGLLRNREHWMLAGLLAVSLFLLWRSYARVPLDADFEPIPSAAEGSR